MVRFSLCAVSLALALAAVDPVGATAFGVDVVPKPSDGRSTVTLALEAEGAARVALYDALGRRVAVLHEGALGQGRHDLPLDAARLAPGLYVVRAEVRPHDGGPVRVVVRRVVLAR